MLGPKVHSSQMPIAIKNSKLDISSEETTKELAKDLEMIESWSTFDPRELDDEFNE